ncbi:MAG: outer membrane beta-barrel domain-containing protein [Myxococcales bacterium]|jgi:outer membrane beta-barrel protein
MKTILRAALVISALALATSAAAEEATEAAAATESGGEAAATSDAVAAGPAATNEEAAAEPAAAGVEAEATEEAEAAEGEASDEEVASPQPAPLARAGDAPLIRISEEQARVIEGAPLGNANVGVHIVERKPYTNEGRHELVLYPAIAQLNSKFTIHVGAAATYAYHLFENLAVQVTPIFHYVNHESAFNQELIDKGHQQAQAATALLLQYGAVGGIEVTPVYGKFAFYEGVLGHFTFVLNAGAGVGNTRIQLRPEQTSNCGPGTANPECRDASFGDTGFKFLGSVGAGFRVFLGERAAVRLEVRDLIYTARVDKINGCSFDDLNELGNGGAPLNASCLPGKFDHVDDRQLAKLLLKETSSDVLNNVSVYTGFSFLF